MGESDERRKSMSSWSSTSWEDSWSSFSKGSLKIVGKRAEEEDDKMTIAEFTQSRQSKGSPISTTPISKVTMHCTEGSTSSSKKRTPSNQSKAESHAMERAEEIRANLETSFPNFLTSMVRSNVSGGFWLGLPLKFCSDHLPKEDIMVSLLDEDQKEYTVKYSIAKSGLTTGWKNFSVVHKLVEGDALVFQLIGPTEFQVYIERAYGKAGTDGILCLQMLDPLPKRIISSERTKTSEKNLHRSPNLVALRQPGAKAISNSEEVGSSEVTGSFRPLETKVNFKDVKNLESFVVAVNGSTISELSEEVRAKYYKLCRSQKAFLHENLSEGINCKLASGLITQTVDISDSIRSSKLSTSRDEFAAWDQSLDVLEQLGMNVGFLRGRIQRLLHLVFDSEEAVIAQKYRKALVAKAIVKEEIRAVEEKLLELEEKCKRYDMEIKNLKEKSKMDELKFQRAVNAPW